MTRRDRNTGWRLPEDLRQKVRAYATQTRRTEIGAAEVLLRKGLDAAEASGEYVPEG